MKIGDLVRSVWDGPTAGNCTTRVGIVVDMLSKSCWRSNIQGKKVNWTDVEPEPHAVVLFPHNSGTITIPVKELEVFNESN